jgi:hypothetical protein
MRDACKKRINTILKITSPKIGRPKRGSVMMMVIIGEIKERRALRKVQTPRNLRWRRRVLSPSTRPKEKPSKVFRNHCCKQESSIRSANAAVLLSINGSSAIMLSKSPPARKGESLR